MTVSSLELKTIVIAGGETSFAYFFPITDISDVKVYFTIAGLDVLQTNYTVDVLDMEEGGNVVFDPAPTPGTKITITRQVGLTQDTNYVENDPFPAEAHEDALDKLTMVAQQLDETLDRCIRLPISDTLGSTTDLPSVENRKLKFLYFDQDGQIAPAEGQLIESTHTHTTFDHLTISGVFAAEYTADVGYLTAAQARFLGHVDMDVDLFVSADINSDGYITTTMDMSCVNITASGGTFTDLTTDTLTANSFGVGALSTDSLDVDSYIVVGDNNGLQITSSTTTSRLDAQYTTDNLCAKLVFTAKDSGDLGSATHTYFETNYDSIYKWSATIDGTVIGKTFRATDFDYDVPTFEGDADVYLAAGNSMYYSIDKDNIADPQIFLWTFGGWKDGIPLMALTSSGLLNVFGNITQNDVQVSLEGHTHDDLYYTEDEVDTISGTLASGIAAIVIPTDFYSTSEMDATVSGIYDDITTVSGAIVDQIPVNEFYFGEPTTSGTFRMTTVSGNLEVQWYDGIDWYTRQTISGAIA